MRESKLTVSVHLGSFVKPKHYQGLRFPPSKQNCLLTECHHKFLYAHRVYILRLRLVRDAGIEPAPPAWEAEILPLN